MIFNQLDTAMNEYKNSRDEIEDANILHEAFLQDKPKFFESFIKNGFDIDQYLDELLLNDYMMEDLKNRRLKSYKVLLIPKFLF
jgi:hypothetical protein